MRCFEPQFVAIVSKTTRPILDPTNTIKASTGLGFAILSYNFIVTEHLHIIDILRNSRLKEAERHMVAEHY